MTTLATRPVEEPDLLTLIADQVTTLGKPFADSFREACRKDADGHDGWINPNRVSVLLREAIGDFSPQRFSAMWGPACDVNGYLDKTNVPEPIDPTVSKGNGNKDVLLRRWRGWSA